MSDDPIRWAEASDAPPGARELVRAIERPPVLPPDLSALVRRRVVRPNARRWIAPGVAASAVIAGGIVLWVWADRTPEPRATVEIEQTLEPAVEEEAPQPIAAPVAPPRVEEQPAIDPPPRRATREEPLPVASPRGMGTLTVNTRPWARVYLDGVYIGTSPIRRRRVPAGRHRVELRTETGTRATIGVEVSPDQEVRIVRDFGGVDLINPFTR